MGNSVNSGSKFERSKSDFMAGMNGGLYFFFNKLLQLTFINHGWSFTYSAPFVPKRFSGFLFNSPSKKFFAAGEIVEGYFSAFVLMFSKISSLVGAKKGGTPVSISYTIPPTVHQSTGFPWPDFNRISGAMYSGVPHTL
jgi:hypothetical protein